VQSPLSRLCDTLGYSFSDEGLLVQSLTHRSAPGSHNERLEFLGDALLNFVIANALYRQFPHVREGELSRMRAKLVCGETLAEMAKSFGIGEYLVLGVGELKSGGFLNESILADSLEAVIAAIYSDSDFLTCEQRVLAWYESRLADDTLPSDTKDAKSQLQEYLQSKQMPLPQYQVKKIEGEAHAQIFHVTCRVEGVDIVMNASGQSRRKAEQLAAEQFLAMIKA